MGHKITCTCSKFHSLRSSSSPFSRPCSLVSGSLTHTKRFRNVGYVRRSVPGDVLSLMPTANTTLYLSSLASHAGSMRINPGLQNSHLVRALVCNVGSAESMVHLKHCMCSRWFINFIPVSGAISNFKEQKETGTIKLSYPWRRRGLMSHNGVPSS